MNGKSYFQSYHLSNDTLSKLGSIGGRLTGDTRFQANPAWLIIGGKHQDEDAQSSENGSSDEDNLVDEKNTVAGSMQFLATQFFLTQSEGTDNLKGTHVESQKSYVLDTFYEDLEHSNKKCNILCMDQLSDNEVLDVVQSLGDKLSIKGTYYLCQSICDTEIDQRMKYANVICTHLLLPKLIDLKEPSRLIVSAIGECIDKFPEDMQKLIFVPMLNADLKDSTAILAIINGFDSQKQHVLFLEFITHVKELKSWHILILQKLLTRNIDDNSKDKLLKLLFEKSLDFCRDKSYGKFILSFSKACSPFSEEQRTLLKQLVAVNKTVFKRPIENIIKNL
ncbi:uncharacterized protein LOC107274952 isoform X2 [Cephus cinctus]|uniref:Uncharacterized protein LOC107274952 isoform X2 n=1 Tax=Cephus cinctus TaxID=211228 RepID=A0AAJ7CGF5_CEPCN|nr:uncharacterized protein LOC107274952 isoform X2 [Cephus cinctus]